MDSTGGGGGGGGPPPPLPYLLFPTAKPCAPNVTAEELLLDAIFYTRSNARKLPDYCIDQIPNYDDILQNYFISMGIIIPLGLVFNILSMTVFGSSYKLRRTTAGHYLIALSIADTLLLIGELLRWLNTPYMEHLVVMMDFMQTNDGVCKLVYLWRCTAKLSSAWITVALTVTVAFPLKVARISTPRIAKIMIGVIYGVSLLLSSFPIWSARSIPYHNGVACSITDPYWYNIENWITIRIGYITLVPIISMLVFSTRICIFLNKAQKVRSREHRTHNLTKALSESRHGKQISRQCSTGFIEHQLTRMIVAMAVTFTVLHLPYTVTYYIRLYQRQLYPNLDMWQGYNIYCAYKITDIIASINHVGNFLLYCYCLRAFRKQLMNLFSKIKFHKPCLGRETTSSTSYSSEGSQQSNAGDQVEMSSDAAKAVRISIREKAEETEL